MPKEPSIIGIMSINFILGLIILYDKINFSNLIFVLLAIFSYLIQLGTIGYLQLSIKLRKYMNIIFPLLFNSFPYIISLYLNQLEILNVLIIKAIILSIFIYLSITIGFNHILNYLVGTSLLTTTFLDVLGFMGEFNLSLFYIWIFVMIYYVSSSYYVESRLVFRKVNPVFPLLTWIVPSVLLILIDLNLILPFLEPTSKHLINAFRNKKLRKIGEIRKMGRIEILRSFIFTIMLFLSYKIII